MSGLEFKLCTHVAGREIAWKGSAIVAEIVADGFGSGGWVTILSPKRGEPFAMPIWARSRTHAHELVEARVA